MFPSNHWKKGIEERSHVVTGRAYHLARVTPYEIELNITG
jgi:hypothetical protein